MKAEITITLRLPILWMRNPVSGMVAIAPAPKNRSKTPKFPSFRPSLSFTYGTIGAQLDIPMPHTKNMNFVADRALGRSIIGTAYLIRKINILQLYANLRIIAKY
jgi:hypothetical protein